MKSEEYVEVLERNRPVMKRLWFQLAAMPSNDIMILEDHWVRFQDWLRKNPMSSRFIEFITVACHAELPMRDTNQQSIFESVMSTLYLDDFMGLVWGEADALHHPIHIDPIGRVLPRTDIEALTTNQLEQFANHFLTATAVITDNDQSQYEHIDRAHEIYQAYLNHLVSGLDVPYTEDVADDIRRRFPFSVMMLAIFSYLGIGRFMAMNPSVQDIIDVLLLVLQFERNPNNHLRSITCIAYNRTSTQGLIRFDDHSDTIIAEFYNEMNKTVNDIDSIVSRDAVSLKGWTYASDSVTSYFQVDFNSNFGLIYGVLQSGIIHSSYHAARIIAMDDDKLIENARLYADFDIAYIRLFSKLIKMCNIEQHGLMKKRLLSTFEACVKHHDASTLRFFLRILACLHDADYAFGLDFDYGTLHEHVKNTSEQILREDLLMGDFFCKRS
jgi:hypothetical protein